MSRQGGGVTIDNPMSVAEIVKLSDVTLGGLKKAIIYLC